MNATAIKLVVNLWHDECPDDPNDWDGWQVHSFSSRHYNGCEPEEIGFVVDDDDNLVPSKELQEKIATGLAFPLSYYEHGQCLWSLQGEGPSCRWDSVRFAGFLIWEADERDLGPKTFAAREKDARGFIDRYTEWCNGSIYGFTVEAFKVCESCAQDEEIGEEEAGVNLPSCGGFYGSDIAFMVEEIKAHIGPDWRDYDVSFVDRMGGYLADECQPLWEADDE